MATPSLRSIQSPLNTPFSKTKKANTQSQLWITTTLVTTPFTITVKERNQNLTHPITEREIRHETSHHQSAIARINNGSFGSRPNSVLIAQNSWQLRFLRQPDDFFFSTLRKGILDSCIIIKDLTNADDVEDISLIDNATTAAIVLQQIGRRFSFIKFGETDSVIMFHCAYQVVKKSIDAYVTPVGGSVIEVQLPFPVHSDQEIIVEFKKGLKRGKVNGGRVRLAIIDYITSVPYVVILVQELIRVCREEEVDQIFADGAHAIGSLHVDVKEIGADFYVSNLYKWLFSPPFVAFLYCNSAWVGMRDYNLQLVVPSILEFVNRFEGGIEGSMRRNHDMVVKMGIMLKESWGTILGYPPEMCAGMIMVGLPSKLCVTSDDDALRVRFYLRVYHAIEVPVYYQALRNAERDHRDKDGFITGYVRISHQVYNTVDDYHRLKTAIVQILENEKICSELPKE